MVAAYINFLFLITILNTADTQIWQVLQLDVLMKHSSYKKARMAMYYIVC